MKTLITGITGFVGSHLAEYLLTLPDTEVAGIFRWRSRTENIDGIKNKVALFECDLRDASSVRNVVKKVKPDMVFHLAAQSYVPMSWHAPAETLTTNIIGQVNIFEAVRDLGMDPLIQVAGSSEEYGFVLPDETPIKETNPLRPLSPYGVSKVAQDLLGYQYFKSYGMKVIRTRAFNHTGPRRGDVFVTSNFAKQLAEIEKKKRQPVIHVGNLDAVRDFSDVRDVVKGYYLSLKKGAPGEVYNISRGRGYTIKDVLDLLVKIAKIDVTIVPDPARMRPSDVELLVGDPAKFEKQTGWTCTIPFEKTMEDLLDYWRAKG